MKPKSTLIRGMTLQHLYAGGGGELVVIRASDFALIDLACAAAENRPADAPPPGLSEDAAAAIAAGENPVRAIRKSLGISQEGLAKRAGIKQSYISQIETGARAGRPTLLRLARALAVPLSAIYPEEVAS